MRLIDADALIKETMERYCKDCERRKGVKNGKWKIVYSIGDAPCRACGTGDMIDELEDAPTIESERKTGRWIPCSERLPSDKERKEWIAKNLNGMGYLYPCLVTRYSRISPERTANNPYVAKHYFDGEDFVNNGEEICSEYVIAWMPLPEPYTERGESDETD